MTVTESGSTLLRARIAASAIGSAQIDSSAVIARTVNSSAVIARTINTSAVIARPIAASAVTRVKLQASALQLHVRTTTAGSGVRSVGGGTGLYSVRSGSAVRFAWARMTGAGSSTRWSVVNSINSSILRITVFSKVGAAGTRSTISRVTGASTLVSWCALR